MRERANGDAERPRAEPEIILPDDAASRTVWRTRFGGTEGIHVVRIGPLGAALLALATAAMAASLLILMAGAFLLVLPFAGVVLAAVILIALLRRVLR